MRCPKGHTPDWKETNNVPKSPVLLACVTSGKRLALSGPQFSIRKSGRSPHSTILSGTEDILAPKRSPTSHMQQSISLGEGREVGRRGQRRRRGPGL